MTTANTQKGWYRSDITGLRTLAIVPVVAFHAGAAFLPGGFIGVDIFFVISGFLITTLLVREATNSSHIRLGVFWTKRIRRLVPALALTIIVTLPVAALLSTVLSWDQLAVQGAASMLFVANIYFWRQSGSYFDTGDAPSPFLHMWSLGVEEQFYLIWPIILLIVVRVLIRASLRAKLTVVFGLVFLTSLAYSVWLSPLDPNAAFYLLPTRAWEFAAGGLLALAPLGRLIRSRTLASTLALLGVAVLLGGVLFLSESVPYPGAFALVPVVGTALVLAAGAGAPRHVLAPVLESAPFVWIGEVSYSWYLWHWPLAVFAVAIFPGSWIAPALSALLALGVAALSLKYVEVPLRFAPRLSKSTARTYVFGGIAAAATLAVATGVFVSGAVLIRTSPLDTYAAAATTLPDHQCTEIVETRSGQLCIRGDPNGARTVALIGDSHAGHWTAALDEVAKRDGVRLIVRWRTACPSLSVNFMPSSGKVDQGCIDYQRETIQLLDGARPDQVIISNAGGYIDVLRGPGFQEIPESERVADWERALTEQVQHFESHGSEVAVFDDNPRMPFNPTACLTTLGRTISSCSATRADSLGTIRPLAPATLAVASKFALPVFSVTDEICGPDRCDAVTPGGIPVYQDQTHLSRAWTSTQIDRLRIWLRELG